MHVGAEMECADDENFCRRRRGAGFLEKGGGEKCEHGYEHCGTPFEVPLARDLKSELSRAGIGRGRCGRKSGCFNAKNAALAADCLFSLTTQTASGKHEMADVVKFAGQFPAEVRVSD